MQRALIHIGSLEVNQVDRVRRQRDPEPVLIARRLDRPRGRAANLHGAAGPGVGAVVVRGLRGSDMLDPRHRQRVTPRARSRPASHDEVLRRLLRPPLDLAVQTLPPPLRRVSGNSSAYEYTPCRYGFTSVPSDVEAHLRSIR